MKLCHKPLKKSKGGGEIEIVEDSTWSFFVTEPSWLKYSSLAMAMALVLVLIEMGEDTLVQILGNFVGDIKETGFGEHAIVCILISKWNCYDLVAFAWEMVLDNWG